MRRLRRLLDAAGDPAERLVVRGQLLVVPAGEAALGEALVHQLEDRHPRLGVLVEQGVEDGAERLGLLLGEEAKRLRRLEPREHDLPRHLVPVGRLREHVEAGKPGLPPTRRLPGRAPHVTVPRGHDRGLTPAMGEMALAHRPRGVAAKRLEGGVPVDDRLAAGHVPGHVPRGAGG